jgi:hypothetical protein
MALLQTPPGIGAAATAMNVVAITVVEKSFLNFSSENI